MRLPAIQGRIGRRLLVNYRVDPGALLGVLPEPFRPKLMGGMGIAGLCLIRLEEERPRLLPRWMGLRSENAAHRIAVEWEEGGQVCEGVYIPRRDTDSRLNAWAGGRVFPGEHHLARFEVRETPDHLSVAMASVDGSTALGVAGRVSAELPPGSVFGDLATASAFFEAGSLGYSATSDPRLLDGLSLHCRQWRMEALDVASVHSSFFEDVGRFPTGSAVFDCALLMRNIEHEWRGERDLCCEPRT